MAHKLSRVLLHSATANLCGRGVEYGVFTVPQRRAARKVAAAKCGHNGVAPDGSPDPDAKEEYDEAMMRECLLLFVKRVTKSDGLGSDANIDELPDSEWVPMTEAVLDEWFDAVTDYDALANILGATNGLTQAEFKAIKGKARTVSAA